MKTKYFSKDFLLHEVLDAENKVEDEIVDTSRWSVIHYLVFRDPESGNYYATTYSVGATEQQDEAPFEFDPDEIKCQQVEKKEVIAHEWVPVQ